MWYNSQSFQTGKTKCKPKVTKGFGKKLEVIVHIRLLLCAT